MAKIYNICEYRAKRVKLLELQELLGELFYRAVIPSIDLPDNDLNYIIPPSLLRRIDDLNANEMDELLNGRLAFFIL